MTDPACTWDADGVEVSPIQQRAVMRDLRRALVAPQFDGVVLGRALHGGEWKEGFDSAVECVDARIEHLTGHIEGLAEAVPPVQAPSAGGDLAEAITRLREQIEVCEAEGTGGCVMETPRDGARQMAVDLRLVLAAVPATTPGDDRGRELGGAGLRAAVRAAVDTANASTADSPGADLDDLLDALEAALAAPAETEAGHVDLSAEVAVIERMLRHADLSTREVEAVGAVVVQATESTKWVDEAEMRWDMAEALGYQLEDDAPPWRDLRDAARLTATPPAPESEAGSGVVPRLRELAEGCRDSAALSEKPADEYPVTDFAELARHLDQLADLIAPAGPQAEGAGEAAVRAELSRQVDSCPGCGCPPGAYIRPTGPIRADDATAHECSTCGGVRVTGTPVAPDGEGHSIRDRLPGPEGLTGDETLAVSLDAARSTPGGDRS